MYTRWLALLSTAFLVLSSLQVGLLGVVLYHDISLDDPIRFVKAYSTDTVSPGHTVNLSVEYEPKYLSQVIVVDRRIACENGTSWSIISVKDNFNYVRNRGSQTMNISFEVPAQVDPRQNCFYSSTVEIPRIILKDLRVTMPPIKLPLRNTTPADLRSIDSGP